MLTRGDANAIPDLPIPRDSLIGRVTSVGNAEAAHHRERVGQVVSRRVAARALAMGVAPARLVVGLMWRMWGMAVKIAARARRPIPS
jgi:hypothetical protein